MSQDKQSNPRNTQFAGFARLLLKDLHEVSETTYASQEDAQKAYELRVSQRAYDFLAYADFATSMLPDWEASKAKVARVPDLTRWPEEAKQQ